jgi:hypothetical protein
MASLGFCFFFGSFYHPFFRSFVLSYSPFGSPVYDRHAARRGSKFDIKDDDTDEAATPIGIFEVQYLGAVPTNSPGGPGVINVCYQALKVRDGE